jgi:hypothetical protein
MTPTGALDSFGTLIKRGNAATPEVFTAIGEVGDIDGPTLKASMEDATSHSSTGEFTETVPTLLDMGDIKFQLNFIPTDAGHGASAGMVYDWKNKVKHNYQMVFPDSTTWTFACYVAEMKFKAKVKGLLTADVTLTITGQPTLA